MFRNRGIAFKLGFSVLAGVVWTFLIAVSANYWFSRRAILTNLEHSAENLTLNIVNHIDTVLAPIQRMTETASVWIEHGQMSETSLDAVLEDSVSRNGEVYGCAIAFEPYAFDPERLYFSPYLFRDKGQLKRIDIGSGEYRYLYADWYAIPRVLEKTVWTEPYFDEGAGNILMTTCATPFYGMDGGKRVFKGVLTADISLEWLYGIVDAIYVLQTGYGFLISQNGTFLTHPHKDWVMNETIFSIESPSTQDMKTVGKRMIAGETGWAPFRDPVDGVDGFLYYAPVHTTGWALGVFFPRQEALADITRLNAIVVLLGIVGLLFLGVVVWSISGSITRPLRKLTEAVRTISSGNLEKALPPPSSGDEVGVLSDSVSRMQASLKSYIQNLTETTAAKERIESELQIAHDIQMGILPRTFPGPPECPQFCVHATLVPAKEVGGDLYDFFFLDPDHFCFVIGDVSGKGVPASLFMAITRTLVKTRAISGIDPGQVLTMVNRDLAADNPSMMFVTMFLAVLTLSSGRLTYSNAGHNLPFRIAGRDGRIEALDCEPACPLGILEEGIFESKELLLWPGDAVFLYTDGVTDAIDIQERLFGEKPMVETLQSFQEAHPREMVEAVLARVRQHAGSAPQFDDITLLALRFLGSLGDGCPKAAI
ncbi:SpoIIE family protein phosphatase [Desulfatirhabdium butyrativorans]|uniref:SpoIIE family protein phosphatase n=1 Tax=Desulfatirhabdium butyrativorans TaxID=340467 RepID=UPI0004119BD5|nr:SpoIIE family protein phosphatase [Desulfatirhabdium butyrativorans]